jgi:hypothetical protein
MILETPFLTLLHFALKNPKKCTQSLGTTGLEGILGVTKGVTTFLEPSKP